MYEVNTEGTRKEWPQSSTPSYQNSYSCLVQSGKSQPRQLIETWFVLDVERRPAPRRCCPPTALHRMWGQKASRVHVEAFGNSSMVFET